MDFHDAVEGAGKVIDVVGVAITGGGALLALAIYFVRLASPATRPDAYRRCRQGLGRAILLGLEFLVAGDIVRTVAISPSFASVGVLAAIVVIRTFLSATLTVEIEGRWPWQPRPGGEARAV